MGDIHPKKRASKWELQLTPSNFKGYGRVIKKCGMAKDFNWIPFLPLNSKIIITDNHDFVKSLEDSFIFGAKIRPSKLGPNSLSVPWSIWVIQYQLSIKRNPRYFLITIPTYPIPSSLVVWILYHIKIPIQDPQGNGDLIRQSLAQMIYLNIQIRIIYIYNTQGVPFNIVEGPYNSISGVITPIDNIILKGWMQNGSHLTFPFSVDG